MASGWPGGVAGWMGGWVSGWFGWLLARSFVRCRRSGVRRPNTRHPLALWKPQFEGGRRRPLFYDYFLRA